MVKLYKTVLILISCYLASYGAEHTDNKNINTEELVQELLRLGETKEQIKNILEDPFYELTNHAGDYTLTGNDITVEEGTVHVLGGPNDPDSNPNFNPSYRFGGKDDPDNELEFNPGKPIFGGKDDPDSKPEFNPGKPIFGGKDDPDSKPEFYPSMPIFGGKDDPDSKPEFYRGKPMFGGKGNQVWDMRRGNDPRKQTIKDSTEEDMPDDMPNNCEKSPHDTLPSPYSIEEICKDKECPEYKVIDNPGGTCGFETRVYGGGKWVKTEFSAREEDGDLKEITKNAYMKLMMGYTKGANSAGVHIPITAPVVTTFVTDPVNNYKPYGGTMMLWLPAEYQNDTPQPTDPEVSILVVPDGNYTRYVRAFGGKFPEPDDFMREFKILGWSLHKSGIKFAMRYPTTLDYSVPWDMKQRHEVMFGDGEMEAIVRELWNEKKGEDKADKVKEDESTFEEVNEEISEKESEGDTPEPYPIDKLCKEVECPPYTVVPLPVGASGFEMRKYSAVKWVTVTLTAEEIKHPELGFTTSEIKLVSYMEGNNVAKIKIPMTIPIAVVLETDPSKPPYRLIGGHAQFYLPTEFQDNAPAPTDPALAVSTQDEVVMMLTAFGGHPSPAEWSKEVTDLVNNIIKADFACVAWGTSVIAAYTDWLDPHQRTEYMFPQC